MRLENWTHHAREWNRIDAAVFRTITSADWRRAVSEARAVGNQVKDRIRNRILGRAGKPAGANEVSSRESGAH